MTYQTTDAPPAAVLIVTDQLPYPPRNGITLPVYNYAVGLQQLGYSLQLLLFVDADQAPPDAAALAENEARFGPLLLLPMRRRGKGRRLLDELSGAEMYQHGWDAAAALPALSAAAVVVSPASAVAKWRSSGLQARTGAAAQIAAVNDCTAAEYYFRGTQSFAGWRGRAKALLDRLRTPLVARVERRLLAPYQQVLLQTRTDAELMARLVSPQIAAKVQLAPNGVRLAYFDLQPRSDSQQIVFVAELSGEYASIADWLVNEVWPLVRRAAPACRLCVVGKGASPTLQQQMAAQPGIVHHSFVPDLAEVYGDAMLVLSPVFKGFGLINKTLEAMASALPVVGGSAAFNGIAAYQDGVHGVAAAPAAAEFAAAIVQLVRDPQRRQHMGQAGRHVVQQQFSWSRTVATLAALLPPARA